MKGKKLLNKVVLFLVLFLFIIFNYSIVKAFAVPDVDFEYYRFKFSNVTAGEFKSLISTVDSNYVLNNVEIYTKDSVLLDDTDLVGTGMKYIESSIEGEKTKYIVIKGDLSGDGKVSALDLSLFKSRYANLITLDTINLMAGDLNNDKEITMVDLSQLKMLLVGLPLPEEEPDSLLPKLDGEIEIKVTPEMASKEVTVTIEYPGGKNLENFVKKVSLDDGETFEEYTEPIIINKNTAIIAGYYSDEETLGEVGFLIKNIDTVAPDDFEFTNEVTTESIILNATTKDKLEDYEGNLVENEYTGVAKYQYKLNDGEWQDSNVFTGLKQDTEYKVYVKAIDYAGNEKEATNNGSLVRTEKVIDANEETILVSYSRTDVTNENVIVTFSFADETLDEKYDIQYQVGGTSGKWVTKNVYSATGNCVIYARLVDKNNQASSTYVTANVKNIDKLQPLEFTPEVEYDDGQDKTILRANAQDAPADDKNLSSGIKYYTYYSIYKDGTFEAGKNGKVEENYQEFEGNLLMEEGVNPIVGFIVDVVDNAGNTRRSNAVYIKDVQIPDGELGIGNFNEGPGNVTVQGADKSYNNPVIPVGFKAEETEEASWGPYLPSGWDNGLVIEDKVGNQFVWVPIPCEEGQSGVEAIDNVILNKRLYADEEETLKDYLDEVPEVIDSGTVVTETGKYGYKYRVELIKQVEEYQGFYIARYEAGRKDGKLATQEGLETINMITYEEAKKLSEEMYKNPYVVSGLPTGTHWDLMAEWVEKEYGRTNEDYEGKGNLSYFEFTFTGRYAEGPDYRSEEIRGAYKNGTNVNKKQNEEMLLTTGIVEEFRMKNMYDLLGNVWEYTAEKVTIANGGTGHQSRGADYYWANYPGAEDVDGIYQWNLNYRSHIPDGDARNEGGFRPVLFLFEGLDIDGFNRTINGERADYNNPVIPAGYYPLDTEEAKWGDGTTPAVDWDKGLVITDSKDPKVKGNEFVWVPVDGANVAYETWLDVFLTHDEVGASETPEGLGKTEEEMISQFNGFYIARYETSTDEDGNAQTKENQIVKTNISYNEAVELTKGYKTGKTSVPGIVTGKQWDTTMRWIANEKGEEAVAEDSSLWGIYDSTIGGTGNIYVKNISDLAGNAWELTSETYDGKIVYRGGSAYESGIDAPAGYRDAYEKVYKDNATTYRMVLYVHYDGYGEPDVSVGEDNPSSGTGAELIKFEPSTSEWTNQSVKVTMSTEKPYKISYTVINLKTNERAPWQTGNEVEVAENARIDAQLIDENGNPKSSIISYWVRNIDKTPPAEFTIEVTLEKNKARIKYSTTDAESGIKQYHFYRDDGVQIREPATGTEVLSNNIPIGEHQIYVVAEDNAGNLRESSNKVTVKIETANLNEMIENGERLFYVSTNVAVVLRYTTPNSHGVWFTNGGGKGEIVAISNIEATLQLIHYHWDRKVPVFNAAAFSVTENFDKDVYIPTYLYERNEDSGELQSIYAGDKKLYGGYIGCGFITYKDGSLRGSCPGLWGWSRAHKNAMVIGGSGTKEDPYKVNFYWTLTTRSDMDHLSYLLTNGYSWFDSHYDWTSYSKFGANFGGGNYWWLL